MKGKSKYIQQLNRCYSLGRNQSNCANTLTKFMKPEQETIRRLKFFEIYDTDNINTIYMKTHNFNTKSNESPIKERSNIISRKVSHFPEKITLMKGS